MENVHPEVLRICGEEGFTKLDCFGFVLDSMRIWEGLGRDCNTLVIRFDKPNEPFGNLRAWRRKKYIASNVVLGLQDATPERLDELGIHLLSCTLGTPARACIPIRAHAYADLQGSWGAGLAPIATGSAIGTHRASAGSDGSAKNRFCGLRVGHLWRPADMH
mgnify:CR=1 FL=1